MPFQALPSSPGFQLPQAPRWEPFAQGAIAEIGKRPIIDTASMVDKAADQINNILEKHSPEAKMERAMKRMQLGAMYKVWSDFKDHPEKYQMTAHGPVLIDVLARSERVQRMNESVERVRSSQSKRNTPTVVNNMQEWKKTHPVEDVDDNAESKPPVVPESAAKEPETTTKDDETARPLPSEDDDNKQTSYFAPDQPFLPT